MTHIFLRRKALVGALCAAVVLIGFGATPSQAAVRSASALGTKEKATGTPVKIGFVTDDKNDKTDNSIETPVANATVKWLNDYKGGIGGHPITLDRCVDLADPGKGTDCANQMIADKVSAVVMGSNAVLENVQTPLKAAGIPVFIYGASNANVVADPNSTFIFSNGPALLQGFPSAVAKANHSKKVSIVAIDVPAATSYFKNQGPADFKKVGLDMELIPVAAGTADMTPQMQRLVSGNPNGTVFVIGNDAFCIAAFNGLRTAAFKGSVTSIPQCISDATRQAVPGDFLKGMKISATSPTDDPKNPSTKQYYAVLDNYGASNVDKSSIGGWAMYEALAGTSVATHDLKGDATPQTITAAAKAMPWSLLPGAGGVHFRCNNKADPTQPAVCTNGLLAGTLNAKGKVTKYTAVGDAPIPAA
jgi:branched-chain amino acid transport system substrate-binding protein